MTPFLIKKCFLIVIVTVFNSAISQTKDTIFFDKSWKHTTKDKAEYYRPLPSKKNEDLYVIEDFYINGQKQMLAFSKSIDSDIYQGKATWFYENGEIKITSEYNNGKLNGSSIRYKLDGSILTKGTYIDDGYSEGFFYYEQCDCPEKTEEFKNGLLVSRYVYYEDGSTLAEKQFYDEYEDLQKSIFYSKEGKTIGEVYYLFGNEDYKLPKSGKQIHFEYNSEKNATKILAHSIISEKDNIVEILTYNKRKSLIASGKILNFKKDGSFLEKEKITTYKKNIKDGTETCCLINYPIKAKGSYKNGYPFNGTFYDKHSRTLTTYKEGIKNGKEIRYSNKFKLQTESNYFRGKINGLRITFNPYTKKQHSATYENGIPKHGSVYEYTVLKTYKDKKIIKTKHF